MIYRYFTTKFASYNENIMFCQQIVGHYIKKAAISTPYDIEKQLFSNSL